MRKKTKSKKTKQKQKQKQSQNVRQTVTVNLGNISKRRPQRRTGTRTGPMVTYQQMPIPLAPSVDYGKLEHTINSLQNNILHSINKRENNNLMTTPAVQEPTPRVNLGTQFNLILKDTQGQYHPKEILLILLHLLIQGKEKRHIIDYHKID